MNTPVIIRDGKAHPITAAQWGLARAYKPIGPVAGLSGTRPPVAVAPVATPAPTPAQSDGRALARASMLKQIGAKYGEDARKGAETTATAAFRRSGLDPKAATAGTPAPAPAIASAARDKGPDGLTMGQRSMLKIVEAKHGRAAGDKMRANLGMRAA